MVYKLSLTRVEPHMGDHMKEFLGENIGWTYNLVMSQILFWVYGFPAGTKYGYSDEWEKTAADDNHYTVDGFGSIPSGPGGSGVVVISTCLVVLATIAFLSKAYNFHPSI